MPVRPHRPSLPRKAAKTVHRSPLTVALRVIVVTKPFLMSPNAVLFFVHYTCNLRAGVHGEHIFDSQLGREGGWCWSEVLGHQRQKRDAEVYPFEERDAGVNARVWVVTCLHEKIACNVLLRLWAIYVPTAVVLISESPTFPAFWMSLLCTAL